MSRDEPMTRGEVLVYEAPDGEVRVDVRLERDTVWLSLGQMAELFVRDKSVISRHLRSVFASRELEREAVVAKSATTAADGKTYQVEYFSLCAVAEHRALALRSADHDPFIWPDSTLQLAEPRRWHL